MQYKIKKGKYNNYILNSVLDHIEDGFLNGSLPITEFDWRKDKHIILVESNENPFFSHELERLFEANMNSGLIKNYTIINPQRDDVSVSSFASIDSFISAFNDHPIHDASICILGHSEKLIHRLSMFLEQIVSAINLSVDLGAIGHNLNYYKEKTNPVNKVMAMVKANAYGHGMIEVAQYLKNKVDYYGVAYVSEGIALREENIHTPIMVMNPSKSDLELCLTYNLEPEIHNVRSLKHLVDLTNDRKSDIAIQIEINTGMNRLGIEHGEIDETIALLKESNFIHINGLYSHLACAEDPTEDEFNRKQLNEFSLIAKKVESELDISTIKHIRNSAGTLRYPDSPTDMIRLGIGLYGVDSNNQFQDKLRNISILKTVVSQIRRVKKGETIGYNRTFNAEKDMTIATIAIGYADGFRRLFSNGVGQVVINGNRVPVVGRVNMDMTMVDVTGLPANEGDEVIIFNESLHVTTLAKNANTIPYEIFTSIGERVGREYIIEL